MNSEPEDFQSPALEAFVAELPAVQVIGQIILERSEGWTLRHVEDRSVPFENLREVRWDQLRPLAQFTSDAAFRPLKSAPNLAKGWWCRVATANQLGSALDQLYPGFIADWYALREMPASVMDFHPYAERQTGMYRIVAMLSPAQAARTVRAHCGPHFCLKSRAWTVSGWAPELPDQKSIIPCLEPCALLLEFSRKAMRLEQADPIAKSLPAEDWETVTAALENALHSPHPGLREADFSDPLNPRRLQLTLEKLKSESSV